jgi:hypothetical protein
MSRGFLIGTDLQQEDCHPRMFLSGVHDFGQLEAGFPIRIASGMIDLGSSGKSVLISRGFIAEKIKGATKFQGDIKMSGREKKIYCRLF